VTYTIEILRSDQKQLSKVERKEQQRIIENIRKLAENPRPSGCKKISWHGPARHCGAAGVVRRVARITL
jgi:mRNA-degrading endonuclease RelE of RelBE toxin-antitoxin system